MFLSIKRQKSFSFFTIYYHVLKHGDPGVISGYRGLQEVAEAYKGFTGGYRGLKGVTRGYRGLQGVTEG